MTIPITGSYNANTYMANTYNIQTTVNSGPVWNPIPPVDVEIFINDAGSPVEFSIFEYDNHLHFSRTQIEIKYVGVEGDPIRLSLFKDTAEPAIIATKFSEEQARSILNKFRTDAVKRQVVKLVRSSLDYTTIAAIQEAVDSAVVEQIIEK